MEHFEIILSLSRAAIGGGDSRATHQIERLRDALRETDPKQAEKLTRLLSREARKQEVAPMSIQQMKSTSEFRVDLPGEKLSKNTPLPHDKETGAPLVRIVFPRDTEGQLPVLHGTLEAAIKDLTNEWGRVKELAALGVQPNLRCLLYGAPGVGKTMLARHIAAKLNLPLVEARLDGLVSSFLGTTARNIGSLFDFANRYQCVLFLDEFDAIAKARDDSQEVGEIKRVVNTLLQSLDARGHQGFTLSATNHEHLLDPAVWRRFESRIEIPLPDEVARATLLERFITPVELKASELKMLVWLTEGMSGADIETLVAGGKRFLVMNADSAGLSKRRPLLAALERLATLNGHLFDEEKRSALLGAPEDLVATLIEGVGLTQSDAAKMLGFSQSKVSRMANEATGFPSASVDVQKTGAG